MFKLIKTRFTENPDVYVVTFRGYEILPFVLLIGIGKKVVFDEFINLIEWTAYEQKKIKVGGVLAKIIGSVYRFWLKSANLILTDTDSHAQFSSGIMDIPINKYVPILVSADEDTFRGVSKIQASGSFTVFYYGSMLPLHGVDIVLDAMCLLKNIDITLILIGGNENTKKKVEESIVKGAKIDYKKWVEFETLPRYIQDSDVCLAGPFGGTVQAQYIITGKAYQFLYMKKPTIVGENEESHIFTDRKDAITVKQANPQELANAIEWAYKNRAKLPAIGQAGYNLYQQKLSNKVLAKQIKELLSRL